jgi:sulfite oxidase
MNGEPIPRDHGGPVRLVVPGYVAARSVKWLTEIYVSDEESRSAWQRGGAYKSFGPSVKSLNAFDAEKYPSVQEMPVQSAITSYTLQQGGKLQVTGWAWSGGGRAIVRVEVSNDGGEMWEEAELTMGSRQPRGRAWAWTMWKVSVPVAEPGKRELVVRAVDESFSCQPERPKAVWNLRGILNNSYHRMSYEAGLHA